MSHDLEASYAATEVAAHLLRRPIDCFSNPPQSVHLSAHAAREGKNAWPHADGIVEMSVSASSSEKKYPIALEFKRPNEGLHGILTAIGQSHAYLRKGYSGAVIVIPGAYSGLTSSGPYVKEVLDLTSQARNIGVFTYSPPDMSKVSPFEGKLRLERSFHIDVTVPIQAPIALSGTETQWAHLREGSSEPDAFFKYLQAVKLLGGGEFKTAHPKVPEELRSAIARDRPGENVEKYLSYCPGEALPDKAWRHFWFKHILTDEVIIGWTRTTEEYAVNDVATKVLRSDGNGYKKFFSGKSNSIKDKLVKQLNDHTINLPDAYEELAQNFHKRAHSYREDIDSGCEHLGFVDSEGRLTDSGYRFVDACERTLNPNTGLPRAIFLTAVLKDGGLGAFLHYIYRLSDERFRENPLDFTTRANGKLKFESTEYLQWLEDEMETRLRVIRKVSERGGVQRKPFQAELAVLRSLGIVDDFRIATGLQINWPEFQNALGLDYDA